MRCESASSSVRCAAAHSYSGPRTKSSRMMCEMGVCQVSGEEVSEEEDEKFPDAMRRDRMAAVNALVVLPV